MRDKLNLKSTEIKIKLNVKNPRRILTTKEIKDMFEEKEEEECQN